MNGTDIYKQGTVPEGPGVGARSFIQRRPRIEINILLFLLTVGSTLYAGAVQQGASPFRDPASLSQGVPFSAALLSILLIHELGHYVMSRRHGVNATLPYFIPVPNLIGTFGAFIMMRGPVRDRRALLDIGVAGPIAGFAVAVPVIIVGLSLSRFVPGPVQGGMPLGSSLLFSFVTRQLFGPAADQGMVILHPIAFAGWIGLLVTALNLLPMGQLDGGHVVYAVFGQAHQAITFGTAFLLLGLGITGWPGWFIWAVLPLLMKVRHPTPLDPVTPLDGKRKAVAVFALVVLVLSFIPAPFPIF